MVDAPRRKIGRPPGSKNKRGANIEFRQFWKKFFESAEGRAHLKKRARESDTILAKLLDKVYPSPASLDLSVTGDLTAGMTFRCVSDSGAPLTPGGGR